MLHILDAGRRDLSLRQDLFVVFATRQDNFYVVGGTITMCRSLSRYTALLIKAALEGIIDRGGVSEGASDNGEVAIAGRRAPALAMTRVDR
jgi:hypothetical protein